MAEIVDFGLQQHKIKMDSRYFENVLSVVAGDTGRRIEVQLLDTNGMVQDTTGLNLRLNAEIAGKATFTDATLVDAATGKYQLDLSNGMFLAPGNWQFQWQITDTAGKKLHSFAFTGNIGKNISEGGSQATNFYLNLEDLKAMQDDLVNGTIDSSILETNITEKLTDLETQYAPKLTEVTAQLAQTHMKDEQSVGWNNIQQDAREIMLGEKPMPVVGVNSVGTPNLINRSVTSKKMYDSKTVDEFDIVNYNSLATSNCIWFKINPITDIGRVSVEYKSKIGQSGKIIIVETSPENPSNATVKYSKNIVSTVGMNYVETDYISNGKGYEYVGVLNAGISYSSSLEVVGNVTSPIFTSDDMVPIVGESFHFGLAPGGKIKLGFNVILSDILISGHLLSLKEQAYNKVSSTLKTPKEVFAEYLLAGGDGVLIGDSNSAGVGTTGYAADGELIGNSGARTSPNAHNWANRFVDTVREINPLCTIRNWGASGWTSKTIIDRGLENYILPTDKIAIIMMGTNDRVGTGTELVNEFENRMQQIVDYCKTRNIPYILMSPIPAKISNDNNTTTYAFDSFTVNNVIKKVANRNGSAHIDNYDWFLQYEEKNGTITDLYYDDLHMNDYGSYVYLYRNIINEVGISYKREGITR